MNILNKLTIRQMKLNRRRTLVTIIGVIISVAMITAVSSIGGSVLSMFKKIAAEDNGEQHVAFINLNQDNVHTLLDSDLYDDYYIRQDLGVAQTPEGFGGKRFFNVAAISQSGFAMNHVTLESGRYPENSSEILLTKTILDYKDEVYSIGDTITLSLGKRFDNDKKELPPQYSFRADETFSPVQTKTYTIVGFAKMSVWEESYLPYLQMITLMTEDELTADGIYEFDYTASPFDQSLFEKADEMHLKLPGTDYQYNHQLLVYNGLVHDFSIRRLLYSISFVLIIIIMIGSIALIYNSFAISVTERSANFGMLSSIGATKKQRKHMVLFEAAVIGLISIPIGILAGLLGIGITFSIVSPLLMSSFGYSIPLKLVVMPSALITAAVFSILTIFISAFIPSIKASRITPMQAIRKTEDIKISKGIRRSGLLTGKLFGLEGLLALKNMKRNKKRYRTTLFSLITSFILFISACSFSFYMKNAYSMQNYEVNVDIAVNLRTQASHTEVSPELMQPVIDQILNLPNIDSAYINYRAYYFAKMPSAITHPSMQESIQPSIDKDGNINYVIHYVAIEDEQLKELAQRSNVSYEALKDTTGTVNAILCNNYILADGNSYADIQQFDLSQTDHIQMAVSDYTVGKNDTYVLQETGTQTLSILGTTSEEIYGVEKKIYDNRDVYVIVSKDVLYSLVVPLTNKGNEYNCQIGLRSDNSEVLAEDIYELQTSIPTNDVSFYYTDYASHQRKDAQMYLVINIFIFGFVALISAVGIANIYNTVSTSLILRKREFAMIRSIGMTPKCFKRMFLFESYLYGIKTMLFGLPIGIGITYLIYHIMSSNFESGFFIPWKYIIAGAAGIFIILIAIMLLASRRLKKESIVESLRNENL